ncbi:MAG TPA: VOC family protein [Pelobium sp.]|nr:VOC family protein [Pelobium sp.]
MLKRICPKLPMRNKQNTLYYYQKLGFVSIGDYGNYLMMAKDEIEIHFFEFETLEPKDNYGQIYIRTDTIDELYKQFLNKEIEIHPNGKLKSQPWGQKEFSLLDPDSNLLTFGEALQN